MTEAITFASGFRPVYVRLPAVVPREVGTRGVAALVVTGAFASW